MLSKPIPMDPEIAALLEKTKNHVMTPDEVAAQRRSWVTGEMMLQHPEMDKKTADQLYDEMLETLGYKPRREKPMDAFNEVRAMEKGK